MQNNMAVNNKRKEKDVSKLMMTGKFEVTLLSENSMNEFEVKFEGPKDSHYEGVSYFSFSPLFRGFGLLELGCQICTLTSLLLLDSKTEFSTPTLTKRKYFYSQEMLL